MELNILKDTKEEVEIEFDNLTMAEILRVYLNKDTAVTLAAWKRGHASENPILIVKTKGKTAKKAIAEAISHLTKELDKIEANFKKLK
jgi:DNA-directed RNA polymerase subunit L